MLLKSRDSIFDVFCAVEDDDDLNKVKLLNPTKIEKIKSSEVERIINEKHWNFIKNWLKNYWYVWEKWCKNFL